MIRIKIDAFISRPVHEVFHTLTDLEGYNDWMLKTGLFRESAKTSEGPVGEGTTFSDKVQGGKAVGEICEFQPPGKVKFRQVVYYHGIKLMESRPGYQLEAVNGNTQLHHLAEGHLYGFFKILKPIMIPIARAERQRTVNSLKHYLEQRNDQ